MLEFVIDSVEKNEEKGGISAFSTFSSHNADKIIMMLTKFFFFYILQSFIPFPRQIPTFEAHLTLSRRQNCAN